MSANIYAAGLPAGQRSQHLYRLAQVREVELCLFSINEYLAGAVEIPRGQRVLPLVVEDSYTPQELVGLYNMCVKRGVELCPIGDGALWDSLIPLELPELAALPVTAVDGDWFEQYISMVAPEPSQPVDDGRVNGTLVHSAPLSLSEPLADLNISCYAPPPTQPRGKRKPSLRELLTVGVKKGACVLKEIGSSLKSGEKRSLLKLVGVLSIPVFVGLGLVVLLSDPDPRATGPEPTEPSAGTQQHEQGATPGDKSPAVPVNVVHKCPEPANYSSDTLFIGKKCGCEHCSAAWERLMAHPNDCPKTDVSKVRQICEGAALGCRVCKNNLIEIKKKHNCGNIRDAEELRLAALYCKKCQETLNELKAHEQSHKDGSVPDGVVIAEWAVKYCMSCRTLLTTIKENCPGEHCTNQADVKQCADRGCTLCRSRWADMQNHEKHCPGAQCDDRTATEQGARLGCATCQARLTDMKSHENFCPGENSTDRPATEGGAALGCETCKARLTDMKSHEGCCPGKNSPDRPATEGGVALGCATCKARLTEMQNHEKRCPGAQSDERSATEQGVALGCVTCKARLTDMQNHEKRCPGKNSSDRAATEQGAGVGCSTCMARLYQMQNHEGRCPGNNSSNRAATEQGAALGCTPCRTRLTEMQRHESSCPGEQSNDRAATEQGAALGCPTCRERLKNIQSSK